MADEADHASEIEQQSLAHNIAQAIKPLPEGTPGECELCGYWSGRLIGGACAPCRDKYKLP